MSNDPDPTHTPPPEPISTPVTVLGLGPMGQAMAATLLKVGHPVTVWNRTPSRADDLVASGASLAPSPADAVAAGQLTILSLTDYQAMYDILGDAVDALADTTLVNLSSDTPEATRKAAEWATGHGARFLAGGVMVPAPMVGSEAAYVYYSGPEPVFRSHEAVLSLLGTPRYVGGDPGLAQLWYQAQLTVFLTSLSGLLQAAAMVEAADVPLDELLTDALDTLTGIPAMVGDGPELAGELERGAHPGDLSTVLMMGPPPTTSCAPARLTASTQSCPGPSGPTTTGPSRRPRPGQLDRPLRGDPTGDRKYSTCSTSRLTRLGRSSYDADRPARTIVLADGWSRRGISSGRRCADTGGDRGGRR